MSWPQRTCASSLEGIDRCCDQSGRTDSCARRSPERSMRRHSTYAPSILRAVAIRSAVCPRSTVQRPHPQVIVGRPGVAVLDAAALALVPAGPGGQLPCCQPRILAHLAQARAKGRSGLLDAGRRCHDRIFRVRTVRLAGTPRGESPVPRPLRTRIHRHGPRLVRSPALHRSSPRHR